MQYKKNKHGGWNEINFSFYAVLMLIYMYILNEVQFIRVPANSSSVGKSIEVIVVIGRYPNFLRYLGFLEGDAEILAAFGSASIECILR
jgi:hypothetical protein